MERIRFTLSEWGDVNTCFLHTHAYSFPVFFGQVYFVLVSTSTNHNARSRCPEMVMARTVYRNLVNFRILEQVAYAAGYGDEF